MRHTNISFLLLAIPLVVLFSIFEPTDGQAQTKTWTGAIDSEWHKAGNWSPTGVPGSGATVEIRPQNGNPYPVISQDVTIATLTLSLWYSGGDVLAANGAALTITNQLNMYSNAQLFILDNSSVSVTGSNNFNGNGSQVIDIDSSGSFTTSSDFNLDGTFNAGAGTVDIGGAFSIANNRTFNTESAAVSVSGTSEIDGTYNGDDGDTIFYNDVEVGDGGVINLDTGTITFNGKANIGDNGTLNMGDGTVNLNSGLSVKSAGYLNVQDGTLNVQGNANFRNNGNMTVDKGTVNISGDATLSNGGNFDLNSGTFNVGGDASFTNGGTVNAGDSYMDLKGDFTVQNGGDFNADSSTVAFTGDETQTINTKGKDITFYNVVVGSNSSLQTDGSAENTIIIENDLTIEEGAEVNIQGDDRIDIQGNLDNQGNIDSINPFIYQISTPSLTEVLVTFDQPMDPQTAEQVSNYAINKGISVTDATLNTANNTEVLLTVSTLTENIEYELEANNIESAAGGEISDNHIKRFTPMVDITYYSRKTGNWDEPESWSTKNHNGPAASKTPNTDDGEDAIIGDNHTITLGSTQDISNLNELTVDNTGTLTVSSGDTLILNTFTIIGGGTFELQGGGTLQVGSPQGIAAQGSAEGNIQTGYRTFSSTANYWYQGTSPQQTGSGLPLNVNDLRINNAAGITANNNLKVNGLLHLQDGTLRIPSGQALIANEKMITNGDLTFNRILSGETGWRMISSPVTATYANFLDGILTQGYEGAQYDAATAPYDTLQPNVLFYDETYEGTDNQRWRRPSSASNSVPAGTGYNVYLFGDVNGDERYNDPMPDTLSVNGQEHEGPVNLGLTYTAEADTGWNLVGNPYGAPIDWDETNSWTKTNIDQTIYVWNPDSKSYKTWNGNTGSLENGHIAPFQAFWVKANAPNPELSVMESAKTFGDNFVGKTLHGDHPEIEIELTHESDSSSIFFSFSEDAKVGKDPLDAYYLQPPPGVGTYAEAYSIGQNNNRFNINSLPITFGVPIEIPISAKIIDNSRSISSAVNLKLKTINDIPASWTVTLIDRETNQELSTSQGNSYSFTTSGSTTSDTSNDSTTVLNKEYHIIGNTSTEDARFALRINPGSAGTGIPNKIDLKQNYPNPFNPSTTIRFTLPIQNEVTLEVFNILGQRVATLIDDESFQAGLHQVDWNPSNAASGTYIYRLITDNKVITKKMTLVK